MLAVIVFPHGFTTALASEAFIVPRASHRRITPTACPGRVLGAEPQVRCRCLRLPQLVRQLRVAPPFPNRAGELSPHSALQSLFPKWRRGLSCMNVLMAETTDDQCFAPSRRHLLHPR